MTQSVKQLSETILLKWALGASTSVPDERVRQHWMPALADLAKMVILEQITLKDIEDYTRSICRDPWKRENPQLWSLRFVRDNILVWVQVANRNQSVAPPTGFKSGIDHLGRIHSWSWAEGREVIADKPLEPDMTPLTTHGLEYVPLATNERVVKREGREGYQRDYFLTGIDSELTEEETRALQEMANDW